MRGPLGIVASSIVPVPPPVPTTGLLFWYDADDLATFTLSGANVTQWRDKSANARHVAAEAGNVTRAVGTIKAGLGSVNFDGSSSLRSSGAGSTGQKPFSVYGVVRHQATATYRAIIGSVWNQALELRLTNAHKLSIMSQYVVEIGQGTAVYPTNAACVFGATYSAVGAWTARLNGAADGGGTNDKAYAPASDALRIGDALAEPLTGQIGELLKYDRVVSGAEQTQIESYLMTKWK